MKHELGSSCAIGDLETAIAQVKKLEEILAAAQWFEMYFNESKVSEIFTEWLRERDLVVEWTGERLGLDPYSITYVWQRDNAVCVHHCWLQIRRNNYRGGDFVEVASTVGRCDRVTAPTLAALMDRYAEGVAQ